MRLPPCDRAPVAVYVWQQDMEPEFPLAVVEYTAHGDGDRMHWHDHFEIALVLEGRGRFMFGRRALAGGAPATSSSSTTRSPTSPWPSPERVSACCSSCSGRSSSPAPAAGSSTSATSRGSGSTSGSARRASAGRRRSRPTSPTALHQLRATFERHDPAERHLVDATLRLALALVNRDAARRRGRPGRRPRGRGPPASRSGRSSPTSTATGASSITLGDVAEVVHVSPSRVRHVFKDVTGVSFKEYVTQVRVTEAKRLLLSTDLSVAEVAGAVSYTNLNQFYKVFHRACAMSPGEYRRVLRAGRRRTRRP